MTKSGTSAGPSWVRSTRFLVLLVLLQPLLAIVPVAALTSVMIMVSINTF